MSLKFLDDFTSVASATNRSELQREVVGFTRFLGFRTMGAMAVADHLGRESSCVWVDNMPGAYHEEADSLNHARIDPVLQHCKHSNLPIAWNQDTYTAVGRGELWETLAQHGCCTGIALALHLPKGRHFFIGLDRDEALPSDAVELTRLVSELQLFAAHALDVALRILLSNGDTEPDIPTLTPRELESLRWTMEGKTAWEVGRILGISEQTVVRHVNGATHKLGCVHKHHAVVKALRLGLIR